MTQMVLDAGAFVAFERGDTAVRAHLAAARRLGLPLATTSPVVAQVWRDGRRQALLSKLLASVRVEPPSQASARAAGELLAKTGATDVVDALLAVMAGDGDIVLTSDPDDLAGLVAAVAAGAKTIRF